MSDQVNITAQVTYQNNLELMLQQNKPAIADKIRPVPVEGEKACIKDFFGAVQTQRAEDRHGDTKYVNTPHDRIWLPKPPEDYVADLVDRHDQLTTKINIGTGYMMSQVAAINRYRDDQCIEGIFGRMISGKDGLTVNNFEAGMTVPVTAGGASGNQRMNIDKLRAATKLLAKGFNDMQMKKYIVLTAEQLEDLSRDYAATSADFQRAYAAQFDAETGYPTRLLGWNIIHLELSNPMLRNSSLTVDGSGFRKNPFWIEDGLVYGEWEGLFTRSSELPTKRYSRDLFAAACVATSRTQNGKVGCILNSEA